MTIVTKFHSIIQNDPGSEARPSWKSFELWSFFQFRACAKQKCSNHGLIFQWIKRTGAVGP